MNKGQAPTGRITLSALIQIINPIAILLSAVAPSLLSIMFAKESIGTISPLLAILALLIAALLNASVDTFNDYYDYVSGNDSADNISSERDSPLAFHKVENPKPIFWISILFLVAAAPMGAYIVWRVGIVPAYIGAAGFVVLITYSGGKLPVSYLPIAEMVSGFTMGGLISLGVFSSITGTIEPILLYKTIPMMLNVSQLHLVNNTCDIERDREVGRRTLPIIIGREKARKLAVFLTIFWIVQVIHATATWYIKGLPILLVILVLSRKNFIMMCTCPRITSSKEQDVVAVVTAAFGIAVGYLLAVLTHLLLV